MEDFILLIYPISICAVLLAGCRIYPSKAFNDNAWNVTQSGALQAFSALMIVLHHLVQAISSYGDIDRGIINAWNYFGILFTSVFFFFSGYGLYKSYREKEGYLEGFLRKRLPRLVIPFLVTNILYIIILSNGRINSLRHFFSSLLGLTLINTNAWFLVELFILYIAFYFCFSKSKSEDKAIIRLAAFVTVLVLFSLLLGHDNSDVNGHWFMGEWWYNSTVVFLMGILIAKNERKIINFVKHHYGIILTASLIMLAGTYILDVWAVENIGYYNEWKYHPGYFTKFVTLLVQIMFCLIFMAVMLLINLKLEYKNPVLKFLGKIGLEIYLVQDIFVKGIYNEDGNMPDWEYLLLTFIFVIAAAFILSLVDRKLLDFYEENEETFLKVRLNDIDSELPYETRAGIKKRRGIISKIKIIYIMLLIGLIVSEAVAVFDYSVLNRIRESKELEALRTAEINDRVYFGSWILDYQKGKKESLSWIVCDKTQDHVLLLSEQVIANSAYHNYHAETDWKDSKLCRSLNHDFYNYAFTKEERGLLCGRREASENWSLSDREAFEYYINKEGKYDEEDIHVKNELIFILNREETERYMPEAEDRIAYPTEAAKLEGLGYRNNGYKTFWWLSDTAENEYSAMIVDDKGNIVESGGIINNKGVGVRPAIWLDIR